MLHFTSSMLFQTKKDEFLSIKQNKRIFMALLSLPLVQAGSENLQARGDADVY